MVVVNKAVGPCTCVILWFGILTYWICALEYLGNLNIVNSVAYRHCLFVLKYLNSKRRCGSEAFNKINKENCSI